MTPLRFAAHAARRLRAVPPDKRMVLAEAVINLAVARLKHVAIPFDRLVRDFGARDFGAGQTPGQSPQAAAVPLSETDRLRVATVKWAVECAARHVPFRAVCLLRAMAARAMLERRRIGSEMHFGVLRRPDGALAAHAWLSAGNLEVTGFPLEPGLVEMTRFAPELRSTPL